MNLINNNAMFQIDLLKGQGIPQKSEPMGILIGIATAFVPVVLAIILYGMYSHNVIVTKFKQQDVVKLEQNISKLSGALETQKNLDRKRHFYNTCLSEVKSSIDKYTQWSPMLAILLEEMPSSIVLKGLEVQHEKVQKNSSGEKDIFNPLNSQEMTVTKLILKISNKGEGDYAEQVKDFRNRLYASPAFGSKLENIVFSRETEQNNGIETISYKIECLFKPEI